MGYKFKYIQSEVGYDALGRKIKKYKPNAYDKWAEAQRYGANRRKLYR